MNNHLLHQLEESLQILPSQRNLGIVFLHTRHRSASWNRDHRIIWFLSLSGNQSNRYLRYQISIGNSRYVGQGESFSRCMGWTFHPQAESSLRNGRSRMMLRRSDVERRVCSGRAKLA